MTTSQLRKKVHDTIDHADERLLRMIYAMTNEYKAYPVKEEEVDIELTAQERKEMYRRSQELKSGKVKGVSLGEAVKKAKAALKK